MTMGLLAAIFSIIILIIGFALVVRNLLGIIKEQTEIIERQNDFIATSENSRNELISEMKGLLMSVECKAADLSFAAREERAARAFRKASGEKK